MGAVTISSGREALNRCCSPSDCEGEALNGCCGISSAVGGPEWVLSV